MFLHKQKRDGVYYLFFKDNMTGKRKKVSTQTTIKSEALKFVSNYKVRAAREKEVKIRLFRFSQEYLSYSQLNHTFKTYETYKNTFNFFITFMGDVYLHTISVKLLNQYFNERIKQASLYQARKDRINIHAFFEYAIRNNYLNSNPVKKIKPFRVPEKQPLYFSREEFSLFLEVTAQDDFKDIFSFAVNTGLRQMELLNLKASQIDLEREVLILSNQSYITKSKKVRTIPLNNTSIKILSKRLPNQEGYIFHNQGRKISQCSIVRWFKKLILKAGLNPDYSFHTLRHTFASWLIIEGVPIYEVKELLGHSDIKMTEIYSHLKADNLFKAVKALVKTDHQEKENAQIFYITNKAN